MKAARKMLELALGDRLPQVDGELSLPGLERAVTIRRDRYGIPHISAETEADGWYGMGFCQGQDRSFQLEFLLRICRGTLAEMVGERGLEVDRLSRRLGFRRSAAGQLEAQDPETREIFEAFCRGVNDGRRLGAPLPHELALLGQKPTEWDPLDVLGMVKFVGFIQSMSWDTQIVRLHILSQDGAEALAALEPEYAAHHPISSPPGQQAGAATARLTEEIARFQEAVGSGGGSNAWVIGAARTRHGRPLVVNDPHLDPSLPSQWYLCHLITPDWSAAGAAFVGTPGFAAGHNGHAAWGTTNGKGDTAGLYLERLGPDGRSVRQGDEIVACEVIEEVIRVRKGEPVTERVLITPHGPIIGPAVGLSPEAISIHATWLAPDRIRGFISAARTKSFQEFRREFAHWPSASLNVTYGDASGVVGWQFTGQIPRRPLGAGYLPEPGWTEAGRDLPRTLDFDELPWFEGGDEDAMGTANNSPTSSEDGPRLGVHWTNGYRAARIYQALDGATGWDIESCLALQMDQVSLIWPEIRGVVTAIASTCEESRTALDLLRAWNGKVSAPSPAASVFELLLHEMTSRIVRAKAPRTWDWAVGKGLHLLSPFNNYAVSRISQTVTLLVERPEGWLDRGWERELDDALAQVIRELRSRFGPDPERWAWGRIRPMTFKHPLGAAPPLDKVFNLGPFPWGGDTTTLSMCTSNVIDPLSGPIMVATLRMVVDVGAWDEARFVLQSGQSGNPLSPHYDDMLPLWQRGDALPLAWSEEKVAAATAHTLRLVPGAARRDEPKGFVEKVRSKGLLGALRRS
jgi:penicillin amidase